MNEVKTVQVGNRLIITNGKDPLRYVDLTTNKVHQYKEPSKLYRRVLRVFHRQPFQDALAFKPEGIYTIGQHENVMNILTTTEVRNICIWYDGTMRPMRGHMGACKWEFDGQIFWHEPLTTNNHS